jgi:hypothetical protein
MAEIIAGLASGQMRGNLLTTIFAPPRRGDAKNFHCLKLRNNDAWLQIQNSRFRSNPAVCSSIGSSGEDFIPGSCARSSPATGGNWEVGAPVGAGL